MARIAGVNLPKNKRIEIALTYVAGIGRSLSRKILTELRIDVNLKADDLTEDELQKVRDYLAKNVVTEGDLRRKVSMDIKRLQDVGCYRGFRHRLRLPVRGQRTKTNARTKRGKRTTVANKKTITK
ncbi:MAG: 30S ribosomal protein S13, small subunit ribosomal protein S13 [Candidatus Peregrinibacteria bacterium GW2011_GWF2_33_10]|nr:MAG: 30S ribosomal protein S13, small subunit ribosomal protein S13 [Candidatus Peregrinibacteria bacterium GW2011_GWF2_33_10]OGJ46115.1 MAG: 30S ribosomal protein S13 [Candidatus Peregrinibacteria bacterium RIFOXYA12_FULL_33_12]OGJ46180.1 MAG: 30S ribosomal protein S13 [Candidatus Peregrinibacteria bacterium RIFOXYA2_FULL_33_21]OGJ51596.1 MAG: 30S ribosomal protein S13 [Candidatus Peregrinibacteria bacterium RIFOXYB2_FULL_33_20]